MTTYSTGIISLAVGGTTYSITNNIGVLSYNDNDKVLVTIRSGSQLVYPDAWPGTAKIELSSSAAAEIEGAIEGTGDPQHGGEVGTYYISPQASVNLITDVTTYFDATFTIARGPAASGSFSLTVSGVQQDPKDGTSGPTRSATIQFQWADRVPNPFSFSDRVNATPNTAYYSFAQLFGFSSTESAIVTGGNVTTAVSNSNSTPSSGSFSSAAKNIVSGQYLHVKMTASPSFNSSVFGTVSVNGVSDTWTITTGAQDTLPSFFSFAAQTNANLNQYYYRVAQITGFTGTLQASASTNTFRGSVPDMQWDVSNSSSLSGVSFQSQPHSITSGQYLHVRVRASDTPESTTGGTMQVGQRSASFLVTTENADTTPNSFSFTDVTNSNLNITHYASAQITGINTQVSAQGLYSATIATTSTNSQPAASAFSTGPIFVQPNHYIWVKMTSSGSFSTRVNGFVLVGGANAFWSVDTRDADLTPDNFSFGTVTNAITQAFYVSKAQITGIEPGVAVSATISGGVSDFAISSSSTIPASSAFSSNPKTITNNQYIFPRLRASFSTGTSQTANVTVGTLTKSFTVTTGTDPSPGGGGTSVAGSETGLASHGLIVYGVDGITPVFGNIRTSALQVDQSFSLSGGGTLTLACLNANDSTKVIIEVVAISLANQENLSVSTTATNFTITNSSQYTVPGRVVAYRIA